MGSFKVLQINAYYPHGSTGKIVGQINAYLHHRGYDSYILYGRGPSVHCDGVCRPVPAPVVKMQSFRAKLTGYPYGGCFFGTRRVLRAIDSIAPDVVHIHCVNGFFVNIYELLSFLKKRRVRTILTLHACFMYTGGCSYTLGCEKWRTGCGQCPQIPSGTHPRSWLFDRTAREWELMREALTGFDKLSICAVSDWVRDEAVKSPLMNEYRVMTVKNGLDTEIYCPNYASGLRSLLSLSGKKVVLHVTPGFGLPVKGGHSVIELAKLMKKESDYMFVIVGPCPDTSSLPSNILAVGRVDDERELAAYYSMADVTLLTSKRETYSMVTAESLCCGTPVVGFKAGGPESIALKRFSSFCDQGDIGKLAELVRQYTSTPFDTHAISVEAAAVYSSEIMCKSYEELYIK